MSLDNSSSECAEQILRFEELTGTNRDEWVTSELKSNTMSIDEDTKRKYYEFSDKDTVDYTEITPFFDYLEKTQPQRLAQLKSEHNKNRGNKDKTKGKWWDSCQYCGHGIVYPFKIKNVSKKLKMVIGSHCIEGFGNVDPFNHLIQKRNEQTLREAMKDWIKPTCIQIWTDERLAKRFYKKDGKRKIIPKQKFINYYESLKELDVNSCSFDDLVRIFRKVDDF